MKKSSPENLYSETDRKNVRNAAVFFCFFPVTPHFWKKFGWFSWSQSQRTSGLSRPRNLYRLIAGMVKIFLFQRKTTGKCRQSSISTGNILHGLLQIHPLLNIPHVSGIKKRKQHSPLSPCRGSVACRFQAFIIECSMKKQNKILIPEQSGNRKDFFHEWK